MPSPSDINSTTRDNGSHRVLPHQAAADDLDDSADHPTIVDARGAVRQREERLNAAHLSTRHEERGGHAESTCPSNPQQIQMMLELAGGKRMRLNQKRGLA